MSLHFMPKKGLLAIFATVITAISTPTLAQTTPAWPTKPIKIIVGYSAGGATDVLTRLVSVGMGNILGQSIVVIPCMHFRLQIRSTLRSIQA